MADEIRNFIRLKDGRSAEERVFQDSPCEQEGVKVTEIWAEPKVEKRLAQRISEHTKPCVYERIVETIDENTGEVVEKKVEALDDYATRMRLVDHIATAKSVSAQSVKDECDCHVTRDEFEKGLATAVEAAVSAAIGSQDHDEYEYEDEDEDEVAPEPQPVQMQSFVGEKVEQSKQGVTTGNLVLLGIIAAQVAGLAYIMFWM